MVIDDDLEPQHRVVAMLADMAGLHPSPAELAALAEAYADHRAKVDRLYEVSMSKECPPMFVAPARATLGG